MVIECTKCNKKMSVPDVVFKQGNPWLICPTCRNRFKRSSKENHDSTSPQKREEEKDGNKTAFLIERKEDGSTIEYKLQKTENLVGRKSQNTDVDIQIETTDTTMSRRHFKITQRVLDKKMSFYISDMNSANGTVCISGSNKWNLQPKQEYLLRDKDIIICGETSLFWKEGK